MIFSERIVDLVFFGFLAFVSFVWVLAFLAYLSFVKLAKKHDPEFYKSNLIFSRARWSISRDGCIDNYLRDRDYKGISKDYDGVCKKYFALLRANEFLMKISLLVFFVKFFLLSS